jgi:hypothetical protein
MSPVVPRSVDWKANQWALLIGKGEDGVMPDQGTIDRLAVKGASRMLPRITGKINSFSKSGAQIFPRFLPTIEFFRCGSELFENSHN